MCQCGVWLRPNQSTMDRIRTAFAALKTPYYRASVIISRGKKSGHNPWQQDHQKAMNAILIINHQQMLLSAFNKLKAKEYLRFLHICGQDKITHWIPQSNNTQNGRVSTGRRICRHLHPQHGQKAQRGGILYLGTINGKNGTLKGWQDKEWWDQR